jgi:hypothetical protein
MYETKRTYEALVQRQVVQLEWALHRRIRHHDRARCPRCGRSGRFDLEGLGFLRGVRNSIYYSTVFNEWRCRICDYRMCA